LYIVQAIYQIIYWNILFDQLILGLMNFNFVEIRWIPGKIEFCDPVKNKKLGIFNESFSFGDVTVALSRRLYPRS